MINFDEITGALTKDHNQKWPYIQNALMNMLNHQQDIDKLFLYVKDPYEDKFHYLIKKERKRWGEICSGSSGVH